MASNEWAQQQQHYDKHALKYKDSRQALRQRSKGPARPLKAFHNDIKRTLIERFAYGADSLLDFCCGRGGDMRKWRDANIQYALGVDISAAEIKEAIKRYTEMMREPSSAAFDFTADFVQCSTLGTADWEPEDVMSFSAVTCNFAIHYFANVEQHFVQFIKNVAANLKTGGYFLGTFPDGKRVVNTLRSRPAFESPMLTLEKMWQGDLNPLQCFGYPYRCAIEDTVTAGHESSEGSHEFLTFRSTLIRVCAHFGLAPVVDWDCPALDTMLDPADATSGIKHFRPNFPDSDPSLETASWLNAAFVFQKLPPDATEAVAPQPRALAAQQAEAHGVKRPLDTSAAEDGGDGFDGYANGEKRARRLVAPPPHVPVRHLTRPLAPKTVVATPVGNRGQGVVNPAPAAERKTKAILREIFAELE